MILIKLKSSFQQMDTIINQIGGMTSSKLSVGQNSTISSGSMVLSFQRNLASNFNSQVNISNAGIKLPNLCSAVGSNNCDNLVLTTQVSYIFQLLFYINK